ncbi:DUF2334 domain-containing protein [Saccharopolyspora sp. WRP15-2]|uniref:DUF2334 domain-containing protein n=1 Tax=Saccharopolyspora oryzae TaxID=2997343 RepID=A0ABT4V745_9PSEU|nr:DUF2334 domain-containing protein [Saccharopolyspora oryzae]MDA3629199.1 DUF2334 domain-containing protein [Saccharopolyspora oryzae]
MSPPLVVSLSGLDVQVLDRCADFGADLDQRAVPLSLLIAPHPAPHAAVLDWVAGRMAARDAVSLHGFARAAPGLRSRLAPAAGLPAHEAGLHLVAAASILERLGLRTKSFIPPRWLGSPGTITALRRRGFSVCADAVAVRELATGRVHRGRIRVIGPGERAEPWWCRALVLGAGRAARRGRPVRLAVDSGVLRKPAARQAVLDAIDLALHHGARPVTYASFGVPGGL